MLGGSSSRTRVNYQQRSGARHQLAPECRKITLKTSDFIDISNATIPTALGGSTTTSSSIVVVVLRQQLDYAAPTTPHLIKAKSSSSKNRLLFTFAAPDARGFRHEKSSCISLTSKKLRKP
jgi:hypothetical protein